MKLGTILCGASMIAFAAMTSPALAQTTVTPAPPADQKPAEPEAGAVNDIVVTANRRSESSQRVAISMTVLSGENLAQHVRTSTDIAQQVPNVQLSNNIGFGMPRTGIRGISQGDFNANATTSNMIYIDDIPLDAPMSQGVPTWDLDRVEVLRGPQGTLFGRNATGGAIRMMSASPGPEAKGFADFSVGEYGQHTFRAAYGGPITDTLGLRVSVLHDDADGDINNIYLNQRQGGNNYTGVRAVLAWKPTDKLSATLRIQHFWGDTSRVLWKTTPGYTMPPMGFPTSAGVYPTLADLQKAKGYKAAGPGSNFHDYESELRPNEHMLHTPISLNVDYNLGFATLSSVTGYLKVKQKFLADNDGTPAILLEEYTTNRNRQFSQELRLTSNGDGPFKWIVGGFYLNGVVDTDQHFDVSDWFSNMSEADGGIPGVPTIASSRATRAEVDTYAAFAHTTYQITPKLMLTAAARWTHEKKKFDYTFVTLSSYPSLVAGTPAQINDFVRAVDSGNMGTVLLPPEPPLSDSRTFSNLSWKVGLDYRLDARSMLYGLVSRGFKGGAFNSTANFRADILDSNGRAIAVRPEVITDYEAGIKSDVIPGRLRVNASAFYYDYRDYQTNQLVLGGAGLQVLSNLPKANLYGGEIEITAEPIKHLTFNLGAGLLHSEITKALDPSLVGNKLPLAEDFNWNALLRYDIETSLGTFSPEVSAKHTGSYYGTKENTLKLGNYTLFNARIDFESTSKKFYGSVWATNLGDKIAPVSVDDPTEFWGSNLAILTQHRRYGVTAGVRF